ncbi:MAG: hypothetical protein WD067_05310 [Gaiellaceae bacterium]
MVKIPHGIARGDHGYDIESFDSSRPCDTNFMNREESPQHRRKLDLEASSDHLDRIALVLSQSGVQLSEVHAV